MKKTKKSKRHWMTLEYTSYNKKDSTDKQNWT